MHQHGLILAIALGLAVSGCAPPGPPDGFRGPMCDGIHHLRAANNAFAAAIDGVTAGEDDQVAIAAAGMGREANAAAAAVIGADAWAPAAQLIVELREAYIDLGDAAIRFRAGARQGSGPELDRAIDVAQDGSAALSRAELEVARLAAAGLQPC